MACLVSLTTVPQLSLKCKMHLHKTVSCSHACLPSMHYIRKNTLSNNDDSLYVWSQGFIHQQTHWTTPSQYHRADLPEGIVCSLFLIVIFFCLIYAHVIDDQ